MTNIRKSKLLKKNNRRKKKPHKIRTQKGGGKKKRGPGVVNPIYNGGQLKNSSNEEGFYTGSDGGKVDPHTGLSVKPDYLEPVARNRQHESFYSTVDEAPGTMPPRSSSNPGGTSNTPGGQIVYASDAGGVEDEPVPSSADIYAAVEKPSSPYYSTLENEEGYTQLSMPTTPEGLEVLYNKLILIMSNLHFEGILLRYFNNDNLFYKKRTDGKVDIKFLNMTAVVHYPSVFDCDIYTKLNDGITIESDTCKNLGQTNYNIISNPIISKKIELLMLFDLYLLKKIIEKLSDQNELLKKPIQDVKDEYGLINRYKGTNSMILINVQGDIKKLQLPPPLPSRIKGAGAGAGVGVVVPLSGTVAELPPPPAESVAPPPPPPAVPPPPEELPPVAAGAAPPPPPPVAEAVAEAPLTSNYEKMKQVLDKIKIIAAKPPTLSLDENFEKLLNKVAVKGTLEKNDITFEIPDSLELKLKVIGTNKIVIIKSLSFVDYKMCANQTPEHILKDCLQLKDWIFESIKKTES
jgi:hypothetical protein